MHGTCKHIFGEPSYTKKIIRALKLLLVSGECGTPTTCSPNARIRRVGHKSAESPDWEFVDRVEINQSYSVMIQECLDMCKRVCIEQRMYMRPYTKWPGCSAFSIYQKKTEGRCWCYGWKNKPEWKKYNYYISGW